MSILNTSHINISTNYYPDKIPIRLTTGGVVGIDSGYPYPILIQSIEDLHRYFSGDSDAQSHSYLLDNGIPLYLIPTLPKGYDHNRASIRFIYDSQDTNSPRKYCGSPRYDVDSVMFQPVQLINVNDLIKLNSGYYTMVYELDFRNITDVKELIGTWLIIRIHVQNESPNSDHNGYRLGIQFVSDDMSMTIQGPNPSSYDNDQLIRIRITDQSTVTSILSDLQIAINSVGITKTITPVEIVYKLCEKYTDSFSNLDDEALFDEGLKLDLGSISTKDLDKYVSGYKSGNNISDFEIDRLFIFTGGLHSCGYIPDIEPESLLYFTFQSNLNLIRCTQSSMNYDIVDWHSRFNRQVEFYSKVVGSLGECELTIKQLSNSIYYVRVSNSFKSEEFKINCGLTPVANTIRLSELTFASELVMVKVYDYLNGNLPSDSIDLNYTNLDIDQVNIDNNIRLLEGQFNLTRTKTENISHEDFNNSLEIFRTSEIYPDVFLVPNLPSIDCIPVLQNLVRGSIGDNLLESDQSIFSQVLVNLDYQNIVDGDVYTSIENRLLYFYGTTTVNGVKLPLATTYLPRFLEANFFGNEPNVELYNELQLVTGSSIIIDPNSMKSRLLIEIIPESDLLYIISKDQNSVFYSVMFDNRVYDFNSRSDFELNSDLPIDFYEESKGLIPLQSILDRNHINYLKYNGSQYYYDFIKEYPNQGGQFIIRMIESLYTRTCYTKLNPIRGSKLDTYIEVLNEINSYCMSRLDFVNSTVTHSVSSNGKILSIKFEITISKLINKSFNINIIINI